MNIQWDAEGYVKQFQFVHEYGNDVLPLLDLHPGQTVLDLGCGNGALTKTLAEMGVNAVGLDASAEHLEIARNRYPDLIFYQKDATDFELTQRMDAVFSNAVFHWIEEEKHPAMLRCVYAALKENGQFAFEFGGKGNNSLIHGALKEAFEKRGYPYNMPFYFPSVGEYAPRLEQAGFRVVYASLFERPTELQGEDGLADWIRMFIRTPFGYVPIEEWEPIIEEAVEQLAAQLYCDGKWYADYVRIRCKAIRI